MPLTSVRSFVREKCRKYKRGPDLDHPPIERRRNEPLHIELRQKVNDVITDEHEADSSQHRARRPARTHDHDEGHGHQSRTRGILLLQTLPSQSQRLGGKRAPSTLQPEDVLPR